jgi:hypothetical protein
MKCLSSGYNDTNGTPHTRPTDTLMGNKVSVSHTHFYSNNRVVHILHFLHFSDRKNEIDKIEKNCDRMWKIQDVFEILNMEFSKYYNPYEHLPVDKVTVLFKGRVLSNSTVQKKHVFTVNIYKFCDSTDMATYLGIYKWCNVKNLTATHATAIELIRKVGCHTLYVDNFFSSPALVDDLAGEKINC